MNGARQIQHLLKKVVPLPNLKQGGTFTIRSPSPDLRLNVRLLPQWRDDGEIVLEQPYDDRDDDKDDDGKDGKDDPSNVRDLDIRIRTLHSNTTTVTNGTDQSHDDDDEVCYPSDWRERMEGRKRKDLPHVSVLVDYKTKLSTLNNDNDSGKGVDVMLTATIPEKLNVNCYLQGRGDSGGCNITVEGKMEGDDGFDFQTLGGNISVSKLRGDFIRLHSHCDGSHDAEMCGDDSGGIIHVKHLLEARDLHVKLGDGGRIRAKMVNGSNANLEVMHDHQRRKHNHKMFEKLDDDDGMALIDVSSIYTSKFGDGAHLAVSPPPHRTTGNAVSEQDYDLDNVEHIRKVRVKSNHGHISVRTTASMALSTSMSSSSASSSSSSRDEFDQRYAIVDLGGVNGSFDVAIQSPGITPFIQNQNHQQQQAQTNDDQEVTTPMAARIHVDSLTPEQISILTSDCGDVGITLDRKVESDIRLLSTPLVNNLDTDVIMDNDQDLIADVLTEHDDDVEDLITSLSTDAIDTNDSRDDEPSQRIFIETDAFTGDRLAMLNHVEYVQGVVENKSQEPDSRFDVKTKGKTSSASVGKIRVDGAAAQALEGFSSGVGGGKHNKSLSSENDDNSRPLVAIATDGNITLESVSWFGAIARRYGVAENYVGKNLGRQAKAGGAKPRQ